MYNNNRGSGDINHRHSGRGGGWGGTSGQEENTLEKQNDEIAGTLQSKIANLKNVRCTRKNIGSTAQSL
jgi:hypothetical protein